MLLEKKVTLIRKLVIWGKDGFGSQNQLWRFCSTMTVFKVKRWKESPWIIKVGGQVLYLFHCMLAAWFLITFLHILCHPPCLACRIAQKAINCLSLLFCDSERARRLQLFYKQETGDMEGPLYLGGWHRVLLSFIPPFSLILLSWGRTDVDTNGVMFWNDMLIINLTEELIGFCSTLVIENICWMVQEVRYLMRGISTEKEKTLNSWKPHFWIHRAANWNF